MLNIKKLVLSLLITVPLFVSADPVPSQVPAISYLLSDSLTPGIPSTPVELGTRWMAFGDSETNGRAYEDSAKSQIIAFQNIWEQTQISPQSVFVNAIGGRNLDGTHSAYTSMYSYLTSPVTWFHFQESGGQSSTQDTPEEFVAVFENMIRSIIINSPNAAISTETAYSFEAEDMTNPSRDWTAHNILMRLKVEELKAEGIALYLAEVDRNIQELVRRKRVELGETDGQQSVWGDENDSIKRHYTGLGNFMVALSMFYALGYDITTLDHSAIVNSEVSLDDKKLCIEIVNSF